MGLESQLGPFTLTPEDIYRSIYWCMFLNGLAIRILGQLVDSPDRWAVLRLDHRVVDRVYRILADDALPSKLRRFSPVSCWNFPYLYATVKRKCFTDVDGLPNQPGPRHRCKKPQHACLRQIVSFACLPSRKINKLLGRGLSFLLRHI